MRTALLRNYFIYANLFISTLATAQQSDRFAYSITDITPQGAQWAYLRKLNLQTGTYSDVLLNGSDATLLANDAGTKKQFTAPLIDPQYGTIANAAFGTNVAAMAYDKKNNRLYYTPMLIDQLRYLDLKTMKVFYVTNRSFTGKPQKSPDQGNIVTRMVIASDGNGYAMTNDGTQLIRFTTNKKIEITDLGTLADDQANTNVSVHNSCSSFGGDMVADDNGNLFVFSARNHVFKVNIETKVATHLGIITGLPAGFTVNGAAVNDNDKVVVSSAVQSSSYFIVDTKTLMAAPYVIAGTVWQSSDLANSNLLSSGKKLTPVTTDVIATKFIPAGDGKINIYPNPVTGNEFSLQFNKSEAGTYLISVLNVTGSPVMKQTTVISTKNQLQLIKLNPAVSKGVYLVQVADADSKIIYNTKVVLQ